MAPRRRVYVAMLLATDPRGLSQSARMALVVDSNSRVHLIGIFSRTSFRERLLQMTELLPPEEILHGYG
jgi:hypothetical protein